MRQRGHGKRLENRVCSQNEVSYKYVHEGSKFAVRRRKPEGRGERASFLGVHDFFVCSANVWSCDNRQRAGA